MHVDVSTNRVNVRVFFFFQHQQVLHLMTIQEHPLHSQLCGGMAAQQLCGLVSVLCVMMVTKNSLPLGCCDQRLIHA